MVQTPAMPRTGAEQLAVVGRLTAAMRLLGVSPDAPYVPRPDHDGHALFALGQVYAHRGQPDAARAALADAAAWFRARARYGEAARVVAWMLNEVALVYMADDPAACDALADEAEWLSMRDASTTPSVVSLVRVRLHYVRGEWNVASSLLSKTHAVRDCVEWDSDLRDVFVALTRLRGDNYQAEASVRAIFPTGPETPPGLLPLSLALRVQRFAVALALDALDFDRARQWLAMHDAWLRWSGATLGRAESAITWARYHRDTGETDRAAAHAARALALATHPRQPLALLIAHRLCGLFVGEAGDWAASVQHFDAAAALVEQCGAANERVQTQVTRAGLHAARGEHDEALRLYRAAAAGAAAMGNTTRVNRIQARVARLPASPAPLSPAAPLPPVTLTAREREVLRLLAAGRSNREIAAHLSISEHTVHTHVRRVLAKTGSDNRAAAATFAWRHGLT